MGVFDMGWMDGWQRGLFVCNHENSYWLFYYCNAILVFKHRKEPP